MRRLRSACGLYITVLGNAAKVLQIGLSYKIDYTFKDLTYHYIFSHTQLGFAMSVACG